ncbi:hypothetical protein ACSX1A_05310 [Pontibacter sp. MBLB2868]|uniref:hypothetical protein n=1 Tax=Pontibacter sp. MBLB2868 TaxID=3451555 RepID=UPI003F750D1A
MNIVFLCGSLELGRDGVGDYTRRLGVELIRHGHRIAAVALKDPGVTVVVSNTQRIDNRELPVLRLPYTMAANKRIELAKNWIGNFNPQWISLQYVPFSFQSKGLPVGLTRIVRSVGQGACLHVMFHELWVGMSVNSSYKQTLWGWAQKQLIKTMLSTLQVKVIHTQTRLYQMQLQKLGFETNYLPLFSNIPAIHNIGFMKHNSEVTYDSIKLVVFGAIHPGAPVSDFAEDVLCYSKKNGKKVSLILIGRSGSEYKRWITEFESVGASVENLGEKSPVAISKVLSSATLGISTTPIALVEKSGAVMAMREHGLPVLCVTKPWRFKDDVCLEHISGVVEYSRGNFDKVISGPSYHPLKNSISEVSTIFINKLQSKV